MAKITLTLPIIDGGSSGNTNLTYTASPTQGTVNSDTGTPAVIPLADAINAGLITPAEKVKIATALQPGDVAQYTDEMAQDAVGAMVTDTSTVRLTYNDGANSMYADLLPSSVNANHLTTTIPLSKFVNDAGFEGVSGLTVRDNANRDRINHTGTQLASTISDFSTASRLATVEDTIVDGVLDKAPSQNAVFDALKIINQNASAVPLYNKYTLAFKGDTNVSLDTLQAGDVVARYYDGAINYYNYNGGNVNDDASYTLIGGLSSTQIGKFVQTYVSGTQDFTLPDFAQIISVFVRGHRTENYTVSGNVITINNVIGSGSEVVILYLEDLATGIVPYYTQAQVDNFHNVPVFNDGTTFVQRFNALKSNRTAQEFIYNSIDSPIPMLGLYAVTLTKWVAAGDFGTMVAVNTEPNTGQVYTKQIYNDVWGDWVEVGAGGGVKSEYYARISAATGLIDVLYNSIGNLTINRLYGYIFSISSPFILQTTKVLVSVSLDSNTNITDNRSIDYKTNNDSNGTILLLLRENNVLKNYTSPAVNISLSIKILN